MSFYSKSDRHMLARGLSGRMLVIAAGALAGATLFGGAPARAWTTQMQPWCALVESVFDCSYYTYDQCMMTTSGNSRYCIANPRVAGMPDERMPAPRRKRARSY